MKSETSHFDLLDRHTHYLCREVIERLLLR